MTEKVTYVVPFSNENILKKWFLRGSIKKENVIRLAISPEQSAPKLLNKFVSELKEKQWIVFCEEWVGLLKPLEPLIKNRGKGVLYGITGARIKKDSKKLQIFDGRTGYNMIDNKVVDALGQGCLIIHSSAIKKHDLQFDEDFKEKYMVDFSLQCKAKGMKTAIISIESRFKERMIPYEIEDIFRKKLRQKYSKLLPLGLFEGTLTENSELDLKTFLNQRENWVKELIKEKSHLISKVKEYEETLDDLTKIQDKGESSQSFSNKNSILEEKLFEKLETKLVWIFGSPRSGSTWLAHDILRKEKIRHLDETMLGAHLGAFQDNPAIHWNLFKGHYKAKFTRIIDRDRDDLFFSSKFDNSWKESLRIFILNRIKAQFGFTGFNYVVLKAPNESHASDILMKCVPNSKLIFLVRDGRDVIDSRQGKYQNPGSMLRPETPDERKFRMSHFAVMWNLMTETTQKAYDSHNPNLRLLVKYEDLRLNPISQIDRIYKFLGYDISEEQIKNIADITSFENVPQEEKGDDKNIRKGKPGGFKEYFSDEELKILNKIMKDNLKKYGYKL